MQAKDAIKKLKSYQKLMELHDENVFKIKQFASFIQELENSPIGLKAMLSKAQKGELKMTESKQILLWDLLETGSFADFEVLMQKTPRGVLEILKLPGLGPKKVRVLWLELGATNLQELLQFCEIGEVAKLKGFGKKTEDNILESAAYLIENQSKLLISEAEMFAEVVMKEIKDFLPSVEIHLVGELKRNLNILSKLQLAIDPKDRIRVFKVLDDHDMLEKDLIHSSPFCWRGWFLDVKCPVEIIVLSSNKGLHLLKLNSSQDYIKEVVKNNSETYANEDEFYIKNQITFIPSPMREIENINWLKSSGFDLQKVVKTEDIKGCLHNHSLYSDGQNTIAEMAGACKSLGLSYFGISDHSKTASYAGGLSEEQIIKQHVEIDDWNSKSPSFKLYKGIESDILNDGSLDYDKSVLASFDFIVSSVHSNLTMKKEEATQRLLKAIENPYTTILGHPTGRLLLKREGYELDFDRIIDACLDNKVCIEINSNPWRLDLDWQYVRKAADKGVMLAINPDAHQIEGINDMQYGLKVAQKAGLYPNQILNCLEQREVELFFRLKK